MPELVGKAARGGLWAAGETALVRGLELLRYVAIARLLVPSQIGLFTFGVLTLSVVKQFSNLGIDAAIIAQDGDIDRQLDAAFSLQIARSLLLAGLLYVAAPIPAAIFGDESVVRLVRLIAVIPLIDTIENPATVVFEKELNFRRRSLFRLSGVLANTVVSVALAYRLRSVDALIAGVIAGAAVHTVVSHLITDHSPWPSLDIEQMRTLFDYGKWLTGSSIVSWIYREGDDALVGAVVGSAGLAYYRSAYQFGQAPQSELTGVISEVAFPTYVQVKDDAHALLVGYRRTLSVAVTAVFPAAIGTALVAPIFVPVVLGSGWEPTVRPLQLIALAAVGHAVAATAGSLWQALERPDLSTKTQTLSMVVLAVTAVPATIEYGVVGTAAAVTVTAFVVAPVRILLVAHLLDASVESLLFPLVGPALATVLMAVAVAPAVTALPLTLIGLLASIGVGVLVYAVAIVALDWTRLDTLAPVRNLLDALR
ncbi:MAG: lipopolysaccharide biosynthesis protein [Halobacteriales archaeon]|nr:lipopolysaccharide biosynthesis protein [Halobacteriales archaeon]